MAPEATDNQTAETNGSICLMATGDLLRSCAPTGRRRTRPGEGIFAPLSDLVSQADILAGNLEGTLPGDEGVVEAEPRVIGDEAFLREVASAGFDVVTLANNHMFDAMQHGFRRTRALLDELDVRHYGAGDDLGQATAPAIVEVRGLTLAFLAAASRSSGVRQFAAGTKHGVAALVMDRLLEQISDLSQRVDHVIVSPHWGRERYSIPSPEQIEQARAMIDAGATLVLGHHPHVLQGTETHGEGLICYSLGNFVAGDVFYDNGDVLTWNRVERTSAVLRATLSKDRLLDWELIPTFDDGRCVRPISEPFGRRRINRVQQRLEAGVTPRRYRCEHLRVDTIRPIVDHLRWRNLRRLRPRHFVNGIRLIGRSLKPGHHPPS